MPRSLKYVVASKKVPEILWYNLQCIVHYEFIPEGKNVNVEIYIDIIYRLEDAVRRQLPEKWRQTFVSPSWQCSSTPVDFGQGFRRKKQCGKTGAFPVLSSPGSISFLCVPLNEMRIEGTEILWFYWHHKNRTEQLKRLAQNGFQERFQLINSRWQNFTVAQEKYFEGNVV